MEKLKVNENSLVVYDIDGTLLDSWGNPIQSIVDTYKHAIQKGFKTAIITARPGTDENILRTQYQLAQNGITGYQYMYFLPKNKRDQALFKLLARKNLHDRGYQVVISIGDMPWDIGQYGGIGFRV